MASRASLSTETWIGVISGLATSIAVALVFLFATFQTKADASENRQHDREDMIYLRSSLDAIREKFAIPPPEKKAGP